MERVSGSNRKERSEETARFLMFVGIFERRRRVKMKIENYHWASSEYTMGRSNDGGENGIRCRPKQITWRFFLFLQGDERKRWHLN